MQTGEYKRAKEALRAATLIENAIRVSAIDAIEEYGASLDAAGMEEYRKQITIQFWENSFQSTNAAKATAKELMKSESRFKYYSERMMSIFKSVFSSRPVKKCKHVLKHYPKMTSTIAFNEVTNAINSKSNISIWQIQEN